MCPCASAASTDARPSPRSAAFNLRVCGASLTGVLGSHMNVMIDTGAACIGLHAEVFDAVRQRRYPPPPTLTSAPSALPS